MSSEPEHCHRIFARLERERREILSELARWPPGCVNFRPSPGAWSAVDVLDHIVRAETGSVEDIRRGLKLPHPIGPEDRPGVAALHRALRSEQRFEVPPGADEILPDGKITFAEVHARWERTREELGLLLNGLGPGDTLAGVFQHPFAGWMNISELLEHFSDHLFHHRFQLARLRASAAEMRT